MFPGDLLWGLFGRTSLLLISVFVFSRSVNLVLDQRLALFLLENAVDSLRDLLSPLEIVGVELWLDLSQLFECSVDPSVSGFYILLGLLRAADPVQPISVRRFVITLRHIVAVEF